MATKSFRQDLLRLKTSESVGAVFTLNVPPSETPEAVEKAVVRMALDAELASKTKAKRLSVKARLRSFAIDAPVALLDKLAVNKLVYGGILNQAPQDLLIRGTLKKSSALKALPGRSKRKAVSLAANRAGSKPTRRTKSSDGAQT